MITDNTGTHRWHVSGWGKPTALDPPGANTWTAEIEFLPGQPNEVLLARVASPRAISAGPRSVAQSAAQSAPPGREGWTYDAARRMILLRFVQTEPTTRVRIEW